MHTPNHTAHPGDPGKPGTSRDRAGTGRSIAPASHGPEGCACRRIRSADLFAGRPTIVIEHEGVEYRLRITRLGKLILTK